MEEHVQDQDNYIDPLFDSSGTDRSSRLTVKQLFTRFILDFLLAIFIGVALFLPFFYFIHGTDYELFLGALFTQTGLLIVCIYRYYNLKNIGHPNLPMFEGPILKALYWGFGVGIALFALNVLHGLIMENIIGFDLEANNPWMEIQDHSKLVLLGTLTVGGIMAPFVEEILLRGIMYGAFAASGRQITGIVFTTLLFILLHLDPVNSVAYAMLGLGFIWVYVKTRNLASAILAHLINNCLGFLFILLPY